MNISQPFILRPVATSLLMIGLLISGAIAYRQLPVSALPQVDYPTIQISTFYPGASPDVVASSITAPLERQFGQLPGLNQMTSSSASGSSVITLQFSLELAIDVAEQQVQAAINSAGSYLPRDLPNPPIYSKTNPADAPILTLALTSETLPLSEVQDLADTRLAQKISQLSGVGLVSLSGGQKPAVRIRANPTALASYGIGLDDIRIAIAAANVNQAKGTLDGVRQSYTIAANDQILSAEGYRSIIVTYRNGAAVRLADVAEILDATENERLRAWAGKTPAVLVNVQRQPGANTIDVVDRIRKLLPQLQQSLPVAIKTDILADRTNTIRASVADVQFELILTIGLVVGVIFAFLRNIPATIVPGVAVPLSLVGSLGVMYLLGYSLNNLTLMALTISTGFVVDDAIVMIENIARYVEEGETPLQAALKGSAQIGFTILSLSVSLIAVLIPLLFMGDITGRLFREFAVTLSITIIISAIVSLTLTPMMSARFLKRAQSTEHGRLYRFSESIFNGIHRFYESTLTVVMRHRTITLLVAIGTMVATVALYIAAPKGFFPVQDTGVIIGVVEVPPNVSFTELGRRQQEVVDVILKDPAVENVSSFIGVDGINSAGNTGRLQIQLRDIHDRSERAPEIIARLQSEVAALPGISLFMQPVQDLTVEDRLTRTQYQFSLESPDSAELSNWVPKLIDELRRSPVMKDVTSDLPIPGPQTRLVIDRDAASRLGVTPTQITDALYSAFGQRQVSTIFTELNQYRVVLEVAPEFRQNAADLEQLYVKATSGKLVPLSAVAQFTQASAPLVINRQGQFPVATLSFNLASGAALGDAVEVVRQATTAIKLPPSIQTSFQGSARAFESSLTNQTLLLLAAIVTVYIVLGVLYESYVHPLTILSTLPSAAVGALLALRLCGIEFGVVALIGVILLIGIVQKNAIMMIDFALEAQRSEGKPADEAIFQACLLRFRPILMTTMAALLAGVPLALGGGMGSELRRPLGIAIVGGLIFSQLLTLYTVPIVYLAFERIGEYFRKSKPAAGSTPATQAVPT